MGHEGRHRTEAFSQLGDLLTLVGMQPRASLRESLPRYTQEEYLEALKQKLGDKVFVKPQAAYEEYNGLITEKKERPPIELPEIFKKGGLV